MSQGINIKRYKYERKELILEGRGGGVTMEDSMEEVTSGSVSGHVPEQ